MKVSEEFPSSGQYLKATDLLPIGGHKLAVIHGFVKEPVGGEPKPVLQLASPKGKRLKDIVLNRINLDTLTMAFGDETDDWCYSACKCDPLMECAPGGGQDQAAGLTVCRALWSSNWAGLR